MAMCVAVFIGRIVHPFSLSISIVVSTRNVHLCDVFCVKPVDILFVRAHYTVLLLVFCSTTARHHLFDPWHSQRYG